MVIDILTLNDLNELDIRISRTIISYVVTLNVGIHSTYLYSSMYQL